MSRRADLIWVDSNYSTADKAVLRYSKYLYEAIVSCEDLASCSQSEGFRLLELTPYRGVQLFLLDECSNMHTGTYKSLDGCLTTAICKQNGDHQIAFSSGSNAGTAWTQYGNRVGMETFFFCPPTTLYKIRGELFEDKLSHLICVSGTDREVKQAARTFSELTGIRLIPRIEWRFLAAGVRAMFLAEEMKIRGSGFDWFAQAICAGFGPIGTYRTFCKMIEESLIPREWLCGFLGIQQSALSPIATAWKNGESRLAHPAAWTGSQAIEPGLYNTHPSETYEGLAEILSFTNGDMVTVEFDEFQTFSQEYVGRLEEAGIRLTVHRDTGEYLERAGLLAGTGVFKAIHSGIVRKGQSVICSLSGGTGPAPVKQASPEFTLNPQEDIRDQLTRYLMERSILSQI